jgi:putative redox protein
VTDTTPKPPARIEATWAGDRRFDAGRPGGPTVRLDGDGKTGPSPVDALVSALATCTMVDVIDILTKRRTPPKAFTVEAVAERAPTTPRRVTHVALDYHVDGESLDRGNTERAIALAITKYCSVRDTLDPTLPIEASLTLNGQPGQPIALSAIPV